MLLFHIHQVLSKHGALFASVLTSACVVSVSNGQLPDFCKQTLSLCCIPSFRSVLITNRCVVVRFFLRLIAAVHSLTVPRAGKKIFDSVAHLYHVTYGKPRTLVISMLLVQVPVAATRAWSRLRIVNLDFQVSARFVFLCQQHRTLSN